MVRAAGAAVDGPETGEQHTAMFGRSHAAVGSASGRTCRTALHFRQWQTVMVFRMVACTSRTRGTFRRWPAWRQA
jgi:hypothetical protein